MIIFITFGVTSSSNVANEILGTIQFSSMDSRKDGWAERWTDGWENEQSYNNKVCFRLPFILFDVTATLDAGYKGV